MSRRQGRPIESPPCLCGADREGASGHVRALSADGQRRSLAARRAPRRSPSSIFSSCSARSRYCTDRSSKNFCRPGSFSTAARGAAGALCGRAFTKMAHGGAPHGSVNPPVRTLDTRKEALHRALVPVVRLLVFACGSCESRRVSGRRRLAVSLASLRQRRYANAAAVGDYHTTPTPSHPSCQVQQLPSRSPVRHRRISGCSSSPCGKAVENAVALSARTMPTTARADYTL